MNSPRFVFGAALAALFGTLGLASSDADAQTFRAGVHVRPAVQPVYGQPTVPRQAPWAPAALAREGMAHPAAAPAPASPR